MHNVSIQEGPRFVAEVVSPTQFVVVAEGIIFSNTGDDGPIAIEDVTGLAAALAGKQPAGSYAAAVHTHALADVTGLAAALADKAALSHTHNINQVTGLAGALADKADLVGGLIPTSQIPAAAITEFLGDVASEAAMLALQGQRGDWCIRTDVNRTYFLINDTPSLLTSWRFIETPASPVVSVNGQTGVIVLGKSDVGLGNVDNTSDLAKPVSTATATELAGKQNVIPALTTAARLALNGLTAPYRVWDTDWRADFVWDGTQWEQATVPIVNDTQMLALPSPQNGYKVHNTTWNSEHIWVGFWQGLRRVVKNSTTQVNNTNALADDPDLQVALTAGVWEVNIRPIIAASAGGWRTAITGPELSTFAVSALIGHTMNTQLQRTSSTGTSTVTASGANTFILTYQFTWECDTNGTLILRWGPNSVNSNFTILYANSVILALRIK